MVEKLANLPTVYEQTFATIRNFLAFQISRIYILKFSVKVLKRRTYAASIDTGTGVHLPWDPTDPVNGNRWDPTEVEFKEKTDLQY